MTMNKVTFAAASSIMNQKPTTVSAASATTSQIAVVHFASSTSAAAKSSKRILSNSSTKSPPETNRDTESGIGISHKPMIGYRNGLSSEPMKSVSIQLGNSHSVKTPNDQIDKSTDGGSPPVPPDARAKQVLKEAVNAVVNSFAKHSHGGYGRGECQVTKILSILAFIISLCSYAVHEISLNNYEEL